MERYDSNSEYYRNYEYEKDFYDAILIEILKVIPRKMRYIGIVLQGVALCRTIITAGRGNRD